MSTPTYCGECGTPVAARFCGACGTDTQPAAAGPTAAGPGGRRRRVPVLVAVAAAVVAAVATAVVWTTGGDSPSTAAAEPKPTYTLTGTLEVEFTDPEEMCGNYGMTAGQALNWLGKLIGGASERCPEGPGGGYGDISDGTQVSVSDAAGTVLAVGHLADGTVTSSGVTFTFTVEGIPQADLYQVETSHRGALRYTFDDLESQNWTVGTTLG